MAKIDDYHHYSSALLSSRLFGFINFLRNNGFSIGADEIEAAHRIITFPDILTSKARLQHLLKAVFCQTRPQWQEFPSLYNAFWYDAPVTDHDDSKADAKGARESRSSGLSYFSESLAEENTLVGQQKKVDLYSGGASDARTLSQRDFRFVFNPHDMRRIERIVDDLSRRMQKRLRHRAQHNRSRGQLNLRKTAHSSLRYHSWPFELHYRRKQKSPVRFLLLLDVSQSMEVYSYLFLRFARGLLQAFKNTDAYAFHTELIHIGEELRDKSTQRLESRLKQLSSGWLGGTRIAASLEKFNHEYANKSIQKDTIIIIFSDGYDSGEPQDLVRQVLKLKSLGRKLVWVNPLLGRGSNAEPLAIEKSLFAVLPHLDLYTSAHSIDSLRQLEPAFRYR